MMRLRFALLVALGLNGCAAAAAVSAIPGVFVDRAVGFFSGKEVSLALDMQRSLAAVQQGLERMSLHANVLEPVADGYKIEFGNGELDGDVYLKRQTENLTTMTVSAHRGMKHQASVESAMLKEVRDIA
ncbi:MAG: SH3 domain-containing protein, partial [Mariprofundaceae bacterium]|nr:SH3 domain-containing protein [Mariprofundaceae bacterium]